MLSEEELRTAARKWYQMSNLALSGCGTVAADRAGDGPYRVFVAVTRPGAASPSAHAALATFPGVPIPHLCQDTHVVCTGRLSLHVMPQRVYEVFGRQAHCTVDLVAALEPAPFAAPPTEADLAAVFVAAMSSHIALPAAAGLGLAVARSCTAIGWRNTAELINSMDRATLVCAADVAAVLGALSTGPAPTSIQPVASGAGNRHNHAPSHVAGRGRNHPC